MKARLEQDLGQSAAAVLSAYRKSRPNASPADLYVAIASERFAGIGSTTIAERKFAQGGAPVYMYVFTHESNRLIPGTNHTHGAAHAAEIVYKFNNVGAGTGQPPRAGGMFDDSRPASVQTARNMSEFWSTFARFARLRRSQASRRPSPSQDTELQSNHRARGRMNLANTNSATDWPTC